MKWWQSQVDEIASDPALRLLGAGLAWTHLLTVIFWFKIGMASWLSVDAIPICWPGFDACRSWHLLTAEQMRALFWCYGAIACANTAAFAFKRLSRLAVWALAGLTVLKFGLMAIDLRSAMNAHPVVLAVTLALLGLPAKRFATQLTIVLIYFTAGMLKLQGEWLSGRSLGIVPEWLMVIPLPIQTWYVVILELFISWLLLLGARPARFFALFQFVVFQGVSFWFIGFYFPCVMYSILPIFFCESRRNFPLAKASMGRIAAFVSVFALLQLAPHIISANPDLTAEGRYFAFHMFDRKTRCEATIVPKGSGENQDPQSFFPDLRTLPARLSCQPITYYWLANDLCQTKKRDGVEIIDFDLLVRIRFESEPESNLRNLIDLKNFCQLNLRYEPLSHNWWILM